MAVELAPGTIFANDFRVVRPLSEGGMGAVFVVEQLSTGAQRALKVMRHEIVADAGLRDRFLQEARVGARIASDHVVQVIAAGIDPRGDLPWLAMELLVGEEVDQRVRRQGPMPRGDVAEVAKQLCHALSAAHAVGVVHRDLKPNNLFLAQSRTAGAPFSLKVLDFGIAKVIEEAQSTGTMSLGTPLWMAPEQTERKGFVGPGTDLWAFGLIVFFVITGKPYWLAASEANTGVQTLMREMLFEPIVPPSRRAAELGVGHTIPAGFDEWFLRLVERDPQRRESQAGRALQGLLAVLQSGPALPPSAPQPTAFGAPLAFTGVQGQSMVQPVVPGPYTAMAPGTGGAWSPPSPMPAIKTPPPAAQSRRSASGAIARGAVGLAVLGIGGFFLFSGDSKKKKKSSDDDDDDDDRKRDKGDKNGSKETPEQQRAADCEKLAAFKKKAEKDVDALTDKEGSPSPVDLDSMAKTLDILSVESKNLDLKTAEAKGIATRYSAALASSASAVRGIASAARTNDATKAQAEAAKFEKLEAEVDAIEADAKKLCPNLDADESG